MPILLLFMSFIKWYSSHTLILGTNVLVCKYYTKFMRYPTSYVNLGGAETGDVVPRTTRDVLSECKHVLKGSKVFTRISGPFTHMTNWPFFNKRALLDRA